MQGSMQEDHDRSSSRADSEQYEDDPDVDGSTAYIEEIKAKPSERPASLSRFSSTSRNIISFEPDDPGNPYNWSKVRKATIVVIGICTVLNSTISSSLPSGDLTGICRNYGVTNDEQEVLPNSIYVLGYVLGVLLFSPLSESYGRRIVYISTFVFFFIFTVATPFSPTWTGFLFFRFIAGFFACSPISIVGGIFADLYSTPVARGRAMALFMTATTWGPVGGPVVSGYLSPYSWRWPLYFMMIFSGVSLLPVAFLPETYGPVILQRRARKMRQQDPACDVWAQIDFEKSTWHDLLVTFLGRPFRMVATEPLVSLTCIYMSFIYGVFYLLLIAYPQIFPPVYGFTLGEEGLTFLAIGIGALFACAVYLWWDWYLRLSKDRGKVWASSEEFRRLPLACLGGPFFMASMFWLGWGAQSDIPWIVPTLAGIPLGIGYLLLFMALLNYIVDAYEIYAASALAAASSTRSLVGVVLPFSEEKLFANLGIQWACSLLGFISLVLCLIPFLFLRYGSYIRSKSKFCQELAAERRKREDREERRKQRRLAESAEKAEDVV